VLARTCRGGGGYLAVLASRGAGQGSAGPQAGTREGAVVAPGGQQAGEDDEHDVHGGARRKRENEVRESIKRTWSRETKDTTA